MKPKDKVPTKKKRFEDFARQGIADLVLAVVQLQKNVIAIQRAMGITGEVMDKHLREIAEEVDKELNPETVKQLTKN